MITEQITAPVDHLLWTTLPRKLIWVQLKTMNIIYMYCIVILITDLRWLHVYLIKVVDIF